jgi:hypothetical protein
MRVNAILPNFSLMPDEAGLDVFIAATLIAVGHKHSYQVFKTPATVHLSAQTSAVAVFRQSAALWAGMTALCQDAATTEVQRFTM